MRARFEEQLELLHRELTVMGALCENAIALSAKALAEGDPTGVERLEELTGQIDRKERDIEGLCLDLLLRQQPVAKDLRVVSSALKMVTDLERIGDNSGDIAEIVKTAGLPPEGSAPDLHGMAQAAIKMVTESVDAFVRGDGALAAAVIAYDDVVDGYFLQVKGRLMDGLGQAAQGEHALDLLMIAKYFERIGDHAVNIAKWVLFALSGQRDVGDSGVEKGGGGPFPVR